MPRSAAHFALGLALLAPLLITLAVLTHVPALAAALVPAGAQDAATEPPLVTKRPIQMAPMAPPTLVPPPPATPTPAPTALPTPTATPVRTSYTVQPGDELKHIAADHGISIWKLIEVNAIANPDSLRVGQTLTIPSP